MARLRTKFLDRAEADLIHEQSLRSLRELGVMIRSPAVLGLLEGAGADVDRKRETARIPEDLVKAALAKAPKRIRYCARDREHDFEIPSSGAPFTATNGLAVHIPDLETAVDHPSTRADLAAFTRLGDALEPVDYLWTSLTATDVPQIVHGIHEIWTTLQNTVKHVEGVTVLSAEDARMQIALAALIAGSEEELLKRPLISIISCPTPPLTFDKGPVEAQLEFAKAGLPVVSMSMSMSGTTSPVTLAGTIANINTENLASLVIDEVAAPGCPHVYASDSAPADMQTGYIHYMAPEEPLLVAAAAQMAERYGLPCMVGGCGLNLEPRPGLLGSFTEVSSIAMNLLSGTDLSSGMGAMDIAKGCSFEQLVIDATIWEDYRAFLRDFTVDEATVALDVVKQVGHSNTFLRHPHTIQHFRKELFFRNPKILAWEATRSDSMIPEARETARRLLNVHEVPPLERSVLREGEALIRSYERAHLAA